MQGKEVVVHLCSGSRPPPSACGPALLRLHTETRRGWVKQLNVKTGLEPAFTLVARARSDVIPSEVRNFGRMDACDHGCGSGCGAHGYSHSSSIRCECGRAPFQCTDVDHALRSN